MFQNMKFEENTFKQYYYQPTLSDEDTTDNLIINNQTPKRKREDEQNIDELFNCAKNKTKKQSQCSSVSRAQANGSVAYMTTNADVTSASTHLLKIEVYDLKKIAKIPSSQHWKHAQTRVKYYLNETNQNFLSMKQTIYNITKEISMTDTCKKMSFNHSDN